MPSEDHRCQYEDDEYDDPMDQRQAPLRFYGRHFRRRHGQTRREPKVVDDSSEQLRDKTTVLEKAGLPPATIRFILPS